MKISEAAKKYEKCMEHLANAPSCDNCPLYRTMTIGIGEKSDEAGAITWKIQGCSLMAYLEKWLQKKKVKEET